MFVAGRGSLRPTSGFADAENDGLAPRHGSTLFRFDIYAGEMMAAAFRLEHPSLRQRYVSRTVQQIASRPRKNTVIPCKSIGAGATNRRWGILEP